MPGLDALLEDFLDLDTQLLGLSVDSRYCHEAWAETFDGIIFPLLADFHPKGEVARAYGLWLEDAGISDRATVLIGK
ncbi:redoxin domain-containing protein, partial [bacterium]|nr:redoxin domain-containing protein [bacterium]